MPRMTRAATRTAIHEDEEDAQVEAADVPLPQTPQRTTRAHAQRAPLGEIALNEKEEESKMVLQVSSAKPEKRAKGKKGKGGKKPKKADSDKENEHDGHNLHDDDDKENTPEVVEDDNQSRPSSAAEEACADLLDETRRAINWIDRDTRPSTPPSKAVRAARKQLSPKAQTPRFNPEVHRTPEPITESFQKEDSFVESIMTRSPAKMITEPEVLEDAIAASDNVTPSLSPSKLSRSPAKSPRIEDSIEAIDAAEEALEKLGQSIHVVEDEPSSPVKTEMDVSASPPKPKVPAVSKTTATKPATRTLTAKKSTSSLSTKASSARRSPVKSAPTTKPISPKLSTKPITPRLANTKTTAVEPKLAATKPAPSSKLTVAKRKTSPTASTTSSKPLTKALTMPIRPKARVASIDKTPFVPKKSTKAPTVSSFTLPGDAVAAKLKEQREKREGEAATTGPSQLVPTASRASTLGRNSARPSISNAKLGPGGTLRLAKAPRATILPEKRIASNTSADSMTVNIGGPANPTTTKRTSTLGRRPTTARASILTNNTSKPSTTASTVSRSTASRPSYVSKTMPAQKPKASPTPAKDIFPRKSPVVDPVQAKKEKDEAIKKARDEAAERGRQASREWAEKMKAKQAAATAAKLAAEIREDTVVETSG